MHATVIIICKDDVAGIEKTLQSVIGVGEERLVYDVSDQGCLDNVLQNTGDVKYCRGEWDGYGHVRFKAATHATYDWILMLHAGETVDERLKGSINSIDENQQMVAYKIPFKNIFCKKWIRFGQHGRYSHIRLGHRVYLNRFNGILQEETFKKWFVPVRKLKGYIEHSPVLDRLHLKMKIRKDALIAAVRYHRKGKRASLLKLIFSPLMTFVSSYLFKFGFLDGWEGFVYAKMNSRYTFLKYCRLRELNQAYNCLNKNAASKAPIIGPTTGIQL